MELHLCSSLLRKYQRQTKQLWRGFSHRAVGCLWPQWGSLPYFLAAQPLNPLLMLVGPSPPTRQKVCLLLQKCKLPDIHFSHSFAAWLWHEPQAHQWRTASQASSGRLGVGEASIPVTVEAWPFWFPRPAVLPRASSSPQHPGLSVYCVNRRGWDLRGDSRGLRTSSAAEFQTLFLVDCFAESELPGVLLINSISADIHQRHSL